MLTIVAYFKTDRASVFILYTVCVCDFGFGGMVKRVTVWLWLGKETTPPQNFVSMPMSLTIDTHNTLILLQDMEKSKV